jgi:hypothetical protein
VYTHTANNDGTCAIKLDGTKIDTVGPWETKAEADTWGTAVCSKYNSPEYVDVDYPNEPVEVTE